MDYIQQRILEIALQLPEYLGYEAKERRRDMDKYTRGTLSRKYNELHTALARIRARAPLDYAAALENLDQKLLRLIARFDTAPRGYAGWFDAAQIVEADLDALTQFDAALANGVPQLKAAIDKLGNAIKSKQDVDEAIDACAELLDQLNAEYDEREQFLATGKKPALSILPNRGTMSSPLGALEAKQVPAPELIALASLRLNDAVTYDGVDYLVTGKITYTIAAGQFWAFQLQDGKKKLWLRVGPSGELAACQEIRLVLSSPQPEVLTYENEKLIRTLNGQAQVNVEGAGGSKRGSVDFARYVADNGTRLWFEDFGSETRAMYGHAIDVTDVSVYRR